MSKYKVGDKVVMKIISADQDEIKTYSVSGVNDDWRWCLPQNLLERYTEPLSTYTEPLEAKIRRQEAEITRLLEENKELKEQMKFDLPTLISEEDRRRMDINKARAEGAEAAWELARKIASTAGGLSSSELVEIFNAFLPRDILSENTYPEAAAKVSQWEKAKEEIKVGDIFQDDDGNNAIVTSVKGNTVYYMWDDGGTRSWFAEDVKKHFIKTGRHIDIDSFLKQIGGE